MIVGASGVVTGFVEPVDVDRTTVGIAGTTDA